MSVITGRRIIGACTLLMLIWLLPAVASAAVPTVAIYSPGNVSTGSSSPTYVLVHDSGVPRAGATVTASATGAGSIMPGTAVTNASGYASFTLNAGSSPGLITITANSGGTQATRYTGVYGLPAGLTMTTPPGLLPADGYCVYHIEGKVTDASGNACSGWPVNVTLDGIDRRIAYAGPDGTYSYDLGPRNSKRTYNITIEANGIILTSSARFMEPHVYLTDYPSSIPAGQNVSITATLVDGFTVAPGILLYCTIYPADNSAPYSYTGYTDQNGRVFFTFQTCLVAGTNMIYVGNQSLGGDLQYASVLGTGGAVGQIVLASYPASVPADGTTHGILRIWARDSGGNPVRSEDLTVTRNYIENYTVTTNSNGYAEIDAGPSLYVGNVRFDVKDANGVANTFLMSYVAGSPALTVIKAVPNVIASSDVPQPQGMTADIHTTQVIAQVTDQWYHPLSGYPITVTSVNTTAGTITGPASNVTDANGEFYTQFTLGSYCIGTGTVSVRAVSGTLSSTYAITYTNNSFLSVDTSVTPRNVSVNGTINVDVSIKGIGWNNRPQPVDMMLITDRSGSMDWYSTYVSQSLGTPYQNTMPDDYNSYWVADYVNPGYDHLQFMLSSPYTNYGNGYGSYYYNLTIVSPEQYDVNIGSYRHPNWIKVNKTYSGTRSSNENYRIITDAVAGTYHVYANAHYTSGYGTPPYSFAVLTRPLRLGSAWLDNDSAAKMAATQLINNMTDVNEMGIVSFSTSATVNSGLGIVDSTKKTQLLNAVSSLNAEGGTSPYTGIQAARNEFRDHGRPDVKHVAILLSDGYSQTPASDIAQAEAARDEGIVIYTIGMGMPDATTLGAIANTTGGEYYYVTSDQELIDRYQQIFRSVSDIVARESSMDLISPRSIVNGTLTNDTEYVPHSALVTFTNYTTAYIEPLITFDGSDYTLSWEPGPIKTNQIWRINYQLKAMHGGMITPISNRSVITYTTSDNMTGTVYFVGDSLFCGDAPNGTIGQTSPGLQIKILSPANATNLTQLRQMVSWLVTYNGTDTYTQRVSIQPLEEGVWLDVSRGFTGDRNDTGDYSFEWNLERVPTGTYTLKVYVTDGSYEAEDNVTIMIPYNSGRIELQ